LELFANTTKIMVKIIINSIFKYKNYYLNYFIMMNHIFIIIIDNWTSFFVEDVIWFIIKIIKIILFLLK